VGQRWRLGWKAGGAGMLALVSTVTELETAGGSATTMSDPMATLDGFGLPPSTQSIGVGVVDQALEVR
jgi:hypothetical protein